MLPMDSKCSLNSMKGGSCGACAWALEARLLPANRPLKTRIVLIDNPSIYATCGMCEARFTLLVGNNRLVGVEEYFIQTARVGHGTKRVRNGKKKKGKTQTGSVIHEFIVYGCFGSCRLLGKKKKSLSSSRARICCSFQTGFSGLFVIHQFGMSVPPIFRLAEP